MPTVDTTVNDCLPSTLHHSASQLVDTTENNSLQSTIQCLASQVMDGVFPHSQAGSLSNASEPITTHHCPPGTKALYLPVPPPIFILPGHQQFAQDPKAIPDQLQQHSHQEDDVFNAVNKLHIECVQSLSHPGGLQKWQNQWHQWSQDVLPTLIEPYFISKQDFSQNQ
ncbi:hypothetical protein F5141DRAFT_1209452 [Pisolithus sp. B1]|nr:hypothetical protein F5141DRAFT_1209452 [Pisolithus sp. B1]